MERKVLRSLAVCLCCLGVANRSASADPANVLTVKAYATSYDANPGWNFVVQLQHRERMRDTKHFCDRVRVATSAGKSLKETTSKCGRGGRPFKDSITGVLAPAGTSKLVVEAHCSKDGWAGRKVEVDLAQAKGEDYELVRDDALRAYIQKLIDACKEPKDSKAAKKPSMKTLMAAKASREELAMIGRVTTPQMLEALKDKEWVVRWSAMDVLGKVGDRKVVLEPLLSMYDDPNGTLRCVAVRTCARYLSDPRVAEATLAKLDAGGGETKYAAQALLRNRHTKPKAVAKLKELLNHKSAGVRTSAFTALKDAGNVDLRSEALAALQNDKSLQILSVAMEYLKGKKDSRPETIEALKRLMNAPAPQTRGEALLALFDIAPAQAYEIGLDTLKTEKDGKARRFMMGKLFKCQARDNRLIDLCIAGLRDPEIKTRSISGKALRIFTKQQVGYYPDALPEYREKQAKKWDEWWAENKATFKLAPPEEPRRGRKRR